MHPMVADLAARYGIPISNRVCGGHDLLQPVWNGQDLASYWLRAKYAVNATNDDEVIVHREMVPLSDHDLLHEIAHWIAAKPEQRDLPEYGLGAVAFQTYHGGNLYPEVVDRDAGTLQEYMCWFMCIYWGKTYNISVLLSEAPYVDDWDHFLAVKISEVLTSFTDRVEIFWQALIEYRLMVEQGSL